MRKPLLLTCLLLIVAVLSISCSGTGDSDSNNTELVESEDMGESDEKTEKEENVEVKYKTEEIAGCTFQIPESAILTESGDRNNSYRLDNSNMLRVSCGIGDIKDWEKSMEAGIQSLVNGQNYTISSTQSVTINDCPAYIIEGQAQGLDVSIYEINLNSKGAFSFIFISTSGYFSKEQADIIVSSLDHSGFEVFRSEWIQKKNEEASLNNTVEDSEETAEQVPEKDNNTDEVEKTKESETQRPAKKPDSGEITYDEDGYIIVTYANRGKLADMDRPNVHLSGTLVDANNICFTIKDEGGHTWTGESAGGHDFTEYIGAECDIYGFCTGGISSRYNTPLVDMAYKDSHISFEDGQSYYPKDSELSDEFPRWNFEDKRENSNVTVWIPTEGGTKYHSYEGCSGMENPEQVTESEAINRGFERCGKCW